MLNLKKTKQLNPILNKLVSENCLSFGRSPKLSNKKITHYISGTRHKIDIFSLYEMRYLLLKVYPLIHNLFLQQRLNLKKKKKITFDKKVNFQNISEKLPAQFRNWEDFRNFKIKFNKPLRVAVRPLLPKILFATTTELYSAIVTAAATKCHMPFHVNRWLSGTITAAASYLDDFEKWSFLTNDFHDKITNSIKDKFFKHKKNTAQQTKQIKNYQLGRKPSLIIIPDVSNNEMIIKETNPFGIPVLGLINSNCNNEIAYPIFANELSIYSIHFFCHFLSSLITKEIAKTKLKFYRIPKKKIHMKFSQSVKEIFKFNARTFKLKRGNKKKSIPVKYFFKGRYFLENWLKPKIKIRKNIKYKKNRHFKDKPKNHLISPKKTIRIEDQKRLEKGKKLYYLKKHVLSKIQLIKKLHHFNFSKIVRNIRLPLNKPKFRFWNQNKFFFSTTLRFVGNTNLAFQFKRFVFPKLLKKKFRNAKRSNLSKKKSKTKNNFIQSRNMKINKKLSPVYRKRWPLKKQKKTKSF